VAKYFVSLNYKRW